MAAITSITGFNPERLNEAKNLVLTLDVNALVFRGMASRVHDRMLDLHNEHYIPEKVNVFTNDEGMIGLFVKLGWDLSCLGSQVLDAPVWPIDTVPTTTIELKAPGKGLDWHNDVSKAQEPNQLYLPLGVGVSVNLVGPAIFKVASTLQPLALSPRLTQQQIDHLAIEASVKPSKLELETALESVLYPGDVVMWRQPVAHQVSVYEEEPNNLRRAIIFIEEDLVTASSPI